MSLVPYRTLFNETKLVPAESLIQRPSAYGIVIHEGKLLVVQAEYTRRYVLPGGIEKGEAIEAALIREVQEETSLDIEVGKCLHFQTDFFYYDPLDLAIHGFLFFYRCQPLTTELQTPNYLPNEGRVKPLWVDIRQLRPESFQSHGELTLSLMS